MHPRSRTFLEDIRHEATMPTFREVLETQRTSLGMLRRVKCILHGYWLEPSDLEFPYRAYAGCNHKMTRVQPLPTVVLNRRPRKPKVRFFVLKTVECVPCEHIIATLRPSPPSKPQGREAISRFTPSSISGFPSLSRTESVGPPLQHSKGLFLSGPRLVCL